MSGRGRGAGGGSASRRATRGAAAVAAVEGEEPAVGEGAEARGVALVERLRAAGVAEDDLREVVSFGELLVEQQQQIEAHIVSARAGGGELLNEAHAGEGDRERRRRLDLDLLDLRRGGCCCHYVLRSICVVDRESSTVFPSFHGLILGRLRVNLRETEGRR